MNWELSNMIEVSVAGGLEAGEFWIIGRGWLWLANGEVGRHREMKMFSNYFYCSYIFPALSAIATTLIGVVDWGGEGTSLNLR